MAVVEAFEAMVVECEAAEEVMEALKHHYRDVMDLTLNASHTMVPQCRRRLFLIATMRCS